jgi:ribonucleoside-diphosphate reductase alpha chain
MENDREHESAAPKPERRRLPNRRESEFVDFEALGFKMTASVSRYPTGEIGEIFLDPDKPGSTLNALLHEIAIAFSFAVQYGAPAADIQRALDRDSKNQPVGPLATALDKFLGRP